ncbi:MAG: glycosyltransferase family 39 protein [Calothrix sp. CSU_2_0]|nr:glycosyltransferase family 39 protein [Calothrix sp. CSU_2_0]
MKRFVLLLGIFLVSFGLRIQSITASLNSDEGLWIYRGSQFFKRLLVGDLSRTFLKHHPGVPNMWISGSGMVLNCTLDKWFPGFLGLDLPENLDACLNLQLFPIALYIIPRILQALVTSGCMVGFYLLSKQLLGKMVAVYATCLLMLEPFFLAYQRFLTTDALLADFSILAVLSLLLYWRSGGISRKFLVMSGILMGLASAAKIIALLLIGAIALLVILIELGVWRQTFPRRGWKRQFWDLGFWGITIFFTFVFIFPAMWVSPGYVINQIIKGVVVESDRGFLFFMGQLTNSPGVLFYPLVLVYRLSPVLQFGLIGAVVSLIFPKLQHCRENSSLVQVLAIIPVCILIILSIFDSKIDRYISNLVIPVFTLLAAVGWLNFITWMRKSFKFAIFSPLSLIFVFIFLQLYFLLPNHPYYLTYYNPLFGGTKVAQNIFMIGQGEGLEQAAKWLRSFPNYKEIKVASWYNRYFGSYFPGEILPINKRITPGIQPWTQAHRVVIYINQKQRQLPAPKMLAYFAKQQPMYQVKIHDVDYATVYRGTQVLREELAKIQFPLKINFGERVSLLGYDLDKSQFSNNQQLHITFYWQFHASISPNTSIKVSLKDGKKQIINQSLQPLVSGFLAPEQITTGAILRDVHTLEFSKNIQFQNIQLFLELVSPNQGEKLGESTLIGEINIGSF